MELFTYFLFLSKAHFTYSLRIPSMHTMYFDHSQPHSSLPSRDYFSSQFQRVSSMVTWTKHLGRAPRQWECVAEILFHFLMDNNIIKIFMKKPCLQWTFYKGLLKNFSDSGKGSRPQFQGQVILVYLQLPKKPFIAHLCM